MMNFLMIFLEMINFNYFLFYFIHILYCDIMKKIKYDDYKTQMGILIDVQHPEDYLNNPTLNSVNIYSDKLLLNYKTLLDKNKSYYIICNKGHLSQKVVSMLEYLGYDVTQVLK